MSSSFFAAFYKQSDFKLSNLNWWHQSKPWPPYNLQQQCDSQFGRSVCQDHRRTPGNPGGPATIKFSLDWKMRKLGRQNLAGKRAIFLSFGKARISGWYLGNKKSYSCFNFLKVHIWLMCTEFDWSVQIVRWQPWSELYFHLSDCPAMT